MYIGHETLLVISLTFLLLGNIPELKKLSLISLFVLGFDLLTNFNITSIPQILHFSVDLLGIAVLSFLSQLLNKTSLKVGYIPIAIYMLLSIHPHQHINVSQAGNQANADTELELLVQLKTSTDIKTWVNNHQDKYDIKYPLFDPKNDETLLDEFVGINIDDQADINQIIESLESNNGVAYVEVNEVLKLDLPQQETTNQINHTQNMNDPDAGKQWAVEKLKYDDLHNLIREKQQAQNSKQIVIAILDTGVEGNHEDLKENYISYDPFNDKDIRGHGTHCAGIAAAVTGNNIGIASLLPSKSKVKITSVKVLSSFGFGSQEQVIKGIIEASDKGASVISLSLGAPSSLERELAYEEAVKYANNSGAIVVTSAGNSNADAVNYSPANTKGIITITAINSNMRKASFANRVDNIEFGLAAPGKDIYSTFPNNKYSYQSGTSMATPLVAGLLGLMKSINPDLTTQEAFQLMKSNAVKKNGMAIVDPYATISAMMR
ncbi:MAG: S8 family serine peptidase [Saprospiraceae bacterium]|nr:S8 family serine peptidase [Saprospiraceae bacterium]